MSKENSPSTEHKFDNKSYPGMGRWKSCRNCGCSYHGGKYWIAGYKSKNSPPCNDSEAFIEWTKQAESAPLGQ